MDIKTALYSVILLLAFIQCSGDGDLKTIDNSIKTHRGRQSVVIGVLPTDDYLPLIVANHYKLMGNDDRVCIKRYSSEIDIKKGFIDSEIDVFIADDNEQLGAKNLKVEKLLTVKSELFLVANAKTRINSIDGLVDKMVGVCRYTTSDKLLNEALASANVQSSVYHIQIADVNLRMKMLKSGYIDAAVLPNPQASQGLNEKDFVELKSFETEKHVVYNSKLTSPEVIKNVYKAATDSIKKYGKEKYYNIL